MPSLNLAHTLDTEILPRVQKPSRYLGTELNAVRKDNATLEVRLALAFPDLYDLGLGNLGLHILYAIVNKLPWAGCERVYAPALDMEKELRSRGLPLFAVESKDEIKAFDGLGFTLQSELTYTNILNLIDLSGMPLRTKDRREEDPLTFAGGPAVFNPEPLAPFMDFFVIGDGEDAIVEIAELFRRVKGRRARLQALAGMEGVYVPELYPMEQLPDGSIRPALDAPKIRKRTTKSLEGSTFPVDYIVPFTQQVHDRVSLEVLRGCTQGCRFCQAGMTTRPVRERSIDKIEDLMKRSLEATGYEEVSLVSLSTCDYSSVRTMVDRVATLAEKERVSVSLPSLRLDSFSVDLADRVADIRRTGLTFAPEAASPRLRALINKWIPDEELLAMSGQAFRLGWDHVKLYFMIGLPTERDDDIHAIADLALRTVQEGRKHNGRAKVNTGVSTFVPKPFTPFQWAAQVDVGETERKQAILHQRFRGSSAIRFGRHNPHETFIEGLVTRGDRRVADLLEAAWRQGARLDAWSEHLDVGAWQRAIEETGFSVADALRERALDERLPWDHIDIHIPKSWFEEDWKRALELKHAQDCRHSKCHKCGVIDVERELCAHMLRSNIDARKSEKAAWGTRTGEGAPEKPKKEEVPEPPSVQRLRLRIGRHGGARFLSHLEAMNAWMRALRRAKVPMAYSQGFHAHPKMTFSAALPTGEESTGDYMDILLSEKVDPVGVFERLGRVLPDGFLLLGVAEVELRAPSLMSAVAGVDYLLVPEASPEGLEARVRDLNAAESIPVQRETKEGKLKTVDLRPLLMPIELGEGKVRVRTRAVEGRLAKPRELVELLGLQAGSTRVIKQATLLAEGQTEIQA